MDDKQVGHMVRLLLQLPGDGTLNISFAALQVILLALVLMVLVLTMVIPKHTISLPVSLVVETVYHSLALVQAVSFLAVAIHILHVPLLCAKIALALVVSLFLTAPQKSTTPNLLLLVVVLVPLKIETVWTEC